MMSGLSSYSFLPFLRQGIANKITTTENDATVKLRASIQVQIQLSADKRDGSVHTEPPIVRSLQLYGPGDIIGIESRAIVRTEPRNWITNFEPNYLPYIEFYDEDFPWRYTPAAPNTTLHRLRPWIMLIVLKEGEFEDGATVKDKPLPQFIYLKNEAGRILPPPDQLWSWAHVHVNRSLTASDVEVVSTDKDAFLAKLQSTLNENRDLAYSRILCPRQLEDNTPYHAFLVPSFESGRLAGLDQDLDPNMPASQSAWETITPAGLQLPYYHRWYFRTGMVGDFEYLVRLLDAKPADKRVGLRDMDVQHPGANLPGITDEDLGGILKLGGALQVPPASMEPPDRAEVQKYDTWDEPYPHDFQKKLASLLNLSDNYSRQPATIANGESGLGTVVEDDTDPVISPPIYGRWHALTERLLNDRAGNDLAPNDNWIHDLNLDPRYRVAAGFGTRIVQKNQEEYMEAAWGQIGDVLEANRRIREAQLAKEVAWIWHERHLKPLYKNNFEKALGITAPMQHRVVADGFTIHHHFRESVIPPSLISTAMRRVLRPGGRLTRTVQYNERPQEDDPRPGNLLTRINDLKINATPPKVTPPGLPTAEAISDTMAESIPSSLPFFIMQWLRKYPWLVYVPLVLIVIVVLLMLIFAFTLVSVPIGIAAIGGLLAIYRLLKKTRQTLTAVDSIRPDQQTVDAVYRLPLSPDFVLSEPGDMFRPTHGNADSVESQRFKDSLRDANLLLQASSIAGAEASRKTLPLNKFGDEIVAKINPEFAIPLRLSRLVNLPERIKNQMTGSFKEAMAYPEFDIPMYKPLVDISADLFLPNLQYIEQNSILLLETNQKFIEAYMVGLNHEFARELLWREYLTDQRGSYFRQFWDKSSLLNADPDLDPDALREKLRDIKAIHRWSRTSKLGEHDNQDPSEKAEEQAVLVIRGELLKKYPTAVIYAHRAKWQPKSETDPTIDKNKERQLDPPFEEVGDNPSRDNIKTPLYEAKVEPDIYFFGFDLTVKQATGKTAEMSDDPGWFFVIKERPGEPRFGLDIEQQPHLNVWNDLSWKNVLPNPEAGHFIKVDHSFSLEDPSGNPLLQEKQQQYEEDVSISWNPDTNSANLAYILYQTPVLVAIHAAELLRKKSEGE